MRLVLKLALLATCIILSAIPGAVRAGRGAAAPDSLKALEGLTVEEIRIDGAKHTKHRLVKGAMTSREGEPFSAANVDKDYEGLDKLGVFSQTHIKAIPGDSGVVLELDVKETFRYLPVITGEISDENGISLGGGLKSVNLLGSGIYLSATAKFGGATTIELIMRSPYQAKSHFTYQLEYYHRDRNNALFSFNEVADEIYLVIQRTMRRNYRLGLEYSYQMIQSDTDGKTLSPDNTDHVSTLGMFAGFDTRDLWSNPSMGWYNTVYGYWSGFLGGDSDFFRLRLDLRRYQRLSPSHVIALFSMFTGTTGEVGTDIAEWQTFGEGGSNSVRGWNLGSRYGKSEFINTAEYRYTWLKPRLFSYFGINLKMGVQVALFADFATAWCDDDGFQKSWISGGGAGIRLIIPYVDMIRFDVSYGEGGIGLSMNVATQEKPDRQLQRVR